MSAFSDKNISAMEAPAKGRKLAFDSHKEAPRGFGIRVSPKGKKTFVLRYNADGKDRLMNVGEYPTWTLAAARKKANELKREIDGGVDILEQRREQRAEQTVALVVEQFCKAHADKLKSGKAVRGTLEKHLVPALGEKRITEVRRRHVIEVVEALAETAPRQASLLLTYTKQVMEWCEDREIIDLNPIASLKAQKVAKSMASKSRSRVLTDAEITALWNMEEPPEGMHRATLLVLKFILATGQRPGEVCNAELSEIQGKLWTIPKGHRGKTGDDHGVPLTDTALALIKQASGERHLFERYKGQSLDVNALSKAVARCADALNNGPGTDRWRPHDLRRTMRTGLAAAGVAETIAETTIGHVRKGIVGVYDQHKYQAEKRAALEAWERRLLLIANGKSPDDSKVVLFGGARHAS